jgi:fatty acid-binding protein DegV
MPGHVTVVTDSAACLTGDLAGQHHVLVGPLRVLAGGGQAADDRPAPLPVIVIDSRSIGMGLGLAVLAAARAASAGQSADDVAGSASRCAAQLGSFFACDTPDLLPAGGRLGGWPGGWPRRYHGHGTPTWPRPAPRSGHTPGRACSGSRSPRADR